MDTEYKKIQSFTISLNKNPLNVATGIVGALYGLSYYSQSYNYPFDYIFTAMSLLDEQDSSDDEETRETTFKELDKKSIGIQCNLEDIEWVIITDKK